MTEKELIILCQKQKPTGQKALYDKYAPVLFSVCKRYLKVHEEAEDVLVESLYKIMTNIHKYSFKGSFEGWMRRIVVNECLMRLRKNKLFVVNLDTAYSVGQDSNIESELQYQDLIIMLNQLPTGYRTIFNLYVIEGYKHREIAEQLGISINTSKSQLILAKKKMRELIKKKQYTNNINYGNS